MMRSGDVGPPNAPKRVWWEPPRDLCGRRGQSRENGNRAGASRPQGTPAFPNVPASREGSRAQKRTGPADPLNLALDSCRPTRLFPIHSNFIHREGIHLLLPLSHVPII